MKRRNFSYEGILPAGMNRWNWLILALLVAALFMLLSASGDLLVPLLGHAARTADYLHGFAHDGRHLLGVPCH